MSNRMLFQMVPPRVERARLFIQAWPGPNQSSGILSSSAFLPPMRAIGPAGENTEP